ncbi:hypothetical protein CEXT_675921 [Caerostris extrusa]|uniref:Uncharacterized protein n=1 Tax=Caerostris extrusa TaxID=172846 RepID=A0AAV4NG46_CAEEX|nr:hypothetical protein CEXT_675921 [Caerostris extrusa]
MCGRVHDSNFESAEWALLGNEDLWIFMRHFNEVRSNMQNTRIVIQCKHVHTVSMITRGIRRRQVGLNYKQVFQSLLSKIRLLSLFIKHSIPIRQNQKRTLFTNNYRLLPQRIVQTCETTWATVLQVACCSSTRGTATCPSGWNGRGSDGTFLDTSWSYAP